jgi:hypothetical protein
VTRRAWILVTSAYLIAFVGLIIALWLIKDQQDDIENLTLNTAAATCLIAFTPEQQEAALIEQFNRTRKIDISHNPECQKAIDTTYELLTHGGP